MGYSTVYTITRVDGDTAAFRRAFSLQESAKHGYRWFGIQNDSSAWKWYEHDDHIKAAMILSNTAAVDLHGVGEEQGDVWDKEYRLSELSLGGFQVIVRKYRYRLVREETPE